MEILKKLNALPFINDLQGRNAEVYVVGGAVRDHYMGRESKDLDIMVCKCKEEALIEVLEKYGTVNLVGKSFGIIKWRAKGTDEDIDIGLPRRDRKGKGNKHTDIVVEVDTKMSIEEELARRDFTINAMAISLDGRLIDPYKGMKDVVKKKITMVDAKAFIDDPLRILRGLQFSARFDFKIEGKTKHLMKENAHLIRNVSKERIAIELEKGLKGGGGHILVQHLLHMGIVNHLTNNNELSYGEGCYYVEADQYAGIVLDGKINTLAELFWLISSNSSGPNIATQLKCSEKVIKECKLLEAVTTLCSKVAIRRLIFEANCAGADISGTKLFDLYDGAGPVPLDTYYSADYQNRRRNYEVKRFAIIKRMVYEMYNGFFPKNLKELDVNGNDLLAWGFREKGIGDALKNATKAILSKKIENDKQEIKEYLGR